MMTNPENNLLQRRNINRESFSSLDDEKIWNDNVIEFYDEDTSEIKEPTFTLMEEIVLLGNKDKEGYTSFWNDSISKGLRGCIMVELAFRGRIALEKKSTRNKLLLERKVIIKNDSSVGDAVLDEALRHIKASDQPENVKSWMEYLSGYSWNPLKHRYHMKNVKERVAKNLVDKGVLRTDKTNFFLFEITTHPLKDIQSKARLVKKIQDTLLTKWSNDLQRLDPRILALIILARVSEVIEVALKTLNDDDYALASKRVLELENLDLEHEASRCRSTEILWAVQESFSEITSVLPLP